MIVNNKNILVVDDDAKDVKTIVMILKPEGYFIESVNSGEKALDFLKTGRPDLILLDIIMPGIDGFELCKQIKNDPRINDIPLMFLSARYDYKDVVKGFELGAVDYITKPFNALELTLRVKSQLTLRSTQQRLKAINQSKDDLLSVLSHDLRNPLISIQSGLKLLYQRTPEKNKEWQQIYDHMSRVSSSAFHLLNTILDWSKTQMSTLEENPQEYDLKDIVNNVTQLYQGTADLCNVKIISDIASQKITVDKEMFSIILRNLLSNAIKYTESGGKIRISAENNAKHKSITVSDTGAGMSSELLNKVMAFDAFGSDVKSSDEFSMGFGLSLCKVYVKRIGGQISAESQLGKGTQVTFTVPMLVEK